MKASNVVIIALMAGCIMLAACEGKVEEKTDSMATTPGKGVDTAATNMGQTKGSEAIEMKVEVKVIAESGLSDVHVDSKQDSSIILSGTTASDAEKAKAESIAKGTDGVRGVENNITVKK